MGLHWVDATEAVVSLVELKDELRIVHSEEDTYLDNLRLAATQYCEMNTDRVFVQRAGFILTLPRFPSGGKGIALRPTPVVQVVSTAYTDPSGSAQSYSGTVRLFTQSEPAILLPEVDDTWPTTIAGTPAGVTITFTCGYGVSVNDTPEPLRKCVLWLAALWHEQRLPASSPELLEVPLHCKAVLDMYRMYGGESGSDNWNLVG